MVSTSSDGQTPDRPPEDSTSGAEPPLRNSQLDLGTQPSYPDDGSLSRTIRQIDRWIGLAEQIVLVALLACLVLTAAAHALLDRFANTPLSFKDHVVRGATFAIAMLGAALASHQMRHLSMDLVSRQLSPRARLFLRVFLAAFTVGIVLVLVRSGLRVIEGAGLSSEGFISDVRLAYLIPIGGALVIVHTVLHAIIDVDYIVRRKTPPERMRSAH